MAWAAELRSLAGEIAIMHENREGYIHGLKDEIRYKMGDWRAGRNKIKAVLWADFDTWDKARKREVANLKFETGRFLSELKRKDKHRAKMVIDLRATVQTYLKKFREVDMARIKESHNRRAQDTAQSGADVYRMIAGFREEREEAASAWRNLTRLRFIFQSEVPEKEKSQGGNECSGNPKRENQILKLIKDNPEGISLHEIAYIMGVTFVCINQEMKALIDTGKVKKKDNKYFLG